MNDFTSTNLKETMKTQTEIKLQNLSVLQPNTRVDTQTVSSDPVFLTKKELVDFEVEKPTSVLTPVSEPKPLLKPVVPVPETHAESVKEASIFENLPETNDEFVVVKQKPPVQKKEETPMERAQNTINDCTPSIGLSLSSARRARQLELLTVAEQTRIPKGIIENIEAGDFEKAPAPVYTRAYIKKLAEFYEIDTKILVDQYNQMLEIQRRSKPVKTNTTNQKRQDCVSSVNLKPMVTKTQGDGKFIKRIALVVTLILITWLVIDCTGGKKPEVKKRERSATTIKTLPSITLKDLTKFSKATELETLKLNVPKNKIK